MKLQVSVGFLGMLLFFGCATAPPTTDQIQQNVHDLLGVPADPGIPQPSITVEPTSIRWTVVRGQLETTESNSQGQSRTVLVPASDSLLGIGFGQGLFLDSQGNLAIVPFDLWPDHWPSGTKYQAVVTPDLWAVNVTKKISSEKTTSGFTIDHTGLFGAGQTKADWPSDEVVALGKRARKNKDGSWWETNAIQMLEMVHSYTQVDSTIKHTEHHLFESSVIYEFDEHGVKSSDKTLSIAVDNDHWVIKAGTAEWWFYVSTDKALIVDVRTGAYGLLSQTSDGALLSSSKGNKETIVKTN